MEVGSFLDDSMYLEKAPFSSDKPPSYEVFHSIVECRNRRDKTEQRCSVKLINILRVLFTKFKWTVQGRLISR